MKKMNFEEMSSIEGGLLKASLRPCGQAVIMAVIMGGWIGGWGAVIGAVGVAVGPNCMDLFNQVD
jgi:bacteriocin-like protein